MLPTHRLEFWGLQAVIFYSTHEHSDAVYDSRGAGRWHLTWPLCHLGPGHSAVRCTELPGLVGNADVHSRSLDGSFCTKQSCEEGHPFQTRLFNFLYHFLSGTTCRRDAIHFIGGILERKCNLFRKKEEKGTVKKGWGMVSDPEACNILFSPFK